MPEEGKDPAAQALGRKRWANTPAKQRTKEMKELAAARWAGHVAKRPASSRKKVVPTKGNSTALAKKKD